MSLFNGKTYYQPGDLAKFENSSEKFEIKVTHKRKTAFTPEQEKINDRVRANLRTAIVSQNNGLLAKFKKSWEQQKLTGNFEDILCQSYLESIKDAVNINSNLIPAFYGFLVASNAGAEGLELALHEALYPGKMVSTSPSQNYEKFVGIHLEDENNSKSVDYEVQCAAPALAIKIITEVQKCVQSAGFQIDDPNMTRFRGPITKITDNIENYLTERMEQLGYSIPN